MTGFTTTWLPHVVSTNNLHVFLLYARMALNSVFKSTLMKGVSSLRGTILKPSNMELYFIVLIES